MPTVLRSGAYRFYFYADDGGEPAHIHVRRGRREVTFWLEPVHLARNRGYAAHELKRIEQAVVRHAPTLIEEWHGYFGA